MEYKIKDFRKELKMSQAELARRACVSRTIISGLENGTIKITTTGTLLKIAEALNKKVSEIFLE
ncbi:helix-turn-helix transcriptional regulator [Dorea sp. D27]|uniref:helix-turn-helix transcriptional regulator n=1 Tax=Dorea sp. D27 TaxID=658665 RepID=UPI000673A43F|nr:helix-turn-helix transcriptional regulator [Dorea sp. D27]